MSSVKIDIDLIAAIDQIQFLLNTRHRASLGCDYKAKTLRELNRALILIDVLKLTVKAGLMSKTGSVDFSPPCVARKHLDRLRDLRVNKFSKVLKYADIDILPQDQFVAAFEAAMVNLASVMDRNNEE